MEVEKEGCACFVMIKNRAGFFCSLGRLKYKPTGTVRFLSRGVSQFQVDLFWGMPGAQDV